MLKVGENVLVAVPGGYSPFIFAGTISEVFGPYGFSLSPGVMIPYSGDTGTWAGIAAGNTEHRQQMRVRVFDKPIRFTGNVSFVTTWEGEIPKTDSQ